MPKTNRRELQRSTVMETFSLFLIVPKKGVQRLVVEDLSPKGIGFYLDLDEEPTDWFDVQVGDKLEILFFLNQSLFIPLTVQIAQLRKKGGSRRIGAEILPSLSKGAAAYKSFCEMLSHLENLQPSKK